MAEIEVEKEIRFVDTETIYKEVSEVKLSILKDFISVKQIDPETSKEVSEVIMTKPTIIAIIKNLQSFLNWE